ncbi:unnamed protein product, partial [Prorocentrum cordatum]
AMHRRPQGDPACGRTPRVPGKAHRRNHAHAARAGGDEQEEEEEEEEELPPSCAPPRTPRAAAAAAAAPSELPVGLPAPPLLLLLLQQALHAVVRLPEKNSESEKEETPFRLSKTLVPSLSENSRSSSGRSFFGNVAGSRRIPWAGPGDPRGAACRRRSHA